MLSRIVAVRLAGSPLVAELAIAVDVYGPRTPVRRRLSAVAAHPGAGEGSAGEEGWSAGVGVVGGGDIHVSRGILRTCPFVVRQSARFKAGVAGGAVPGHSRKVVVRIVPPLDVRVGGAGRRVGVAGGAVIVDKGRRTGEVHVARVAGRRRRDGGNTACRMAVRAVAVKSCLCRREVIQVAVRHRVVRLAGAVGMASRAVEGVGEAARRARLRSCPGPVHAVADGAGHVPVPRVPV